MNKNKWLLLIVVVLVVALGYWLMGKESGWVGDTSYSPNPTASLPVAKAGSSTKKSPAPVAPTRSYTEMVKEYEGRRIQFDQRCQMVPTSVTYKNGTSIMLDNRSSDAKTVKVGSNSYSLAGYGYQVVTLSGSSLPQEVSVSCGSVNVGKILL